MNEPVINTENATLWSDGSFHVSNITAATVHNPDAEVLRSIADAIEELLPHSADELREIANKLDA